MQEERNARRKKCQLLLLPFPVGYSGSCSDRRKTTESLKDPEKLIDKLIGYILQIRRQRGKIAYHDKDIIAMDETAVGQDMVSNTMVDNIGESTIRLNTTGHEKQKFQCVWLQRETVPN